MTSALQTPVLFLIFNRPDTTLQVFNQLRKIQPEQLFIASDGARKHVTGEKEKTDQCREIVSHIDWDCQVKTLFRGENLGCGLAVSSAISWFFDQVTEGIILEDDCIPDPSFFPFCEELLLRYRDVDKVKLISGNNFQNGIQRGKGSYYFSHYPEIWGWASWKRVWDEYDFRIQDLEKTFASESVKEAYSTADEREYWLKKFRLAADGKADTWDYQLTYSILKNRGLAITPQVNLVKNIGLENNATHLSLKDSYKNLQLNSISFPLKHPVMRVDRAADFHSFSGIYMHSFSRLFRLIKENGIINFIKYYLAQYRK